jgi:CUB domain
VVKLDFYYFNTQPDADFVDVYDGVDENARLLGRMSGTYCSPPAGYTTTQRYMLLKFNTDSKTVFNGFGATFQTAIYGEQQFRKVANSTSSVVYLD